jgi:alkylation response protein AidB-like acyl-CoA dehydrogenase
MDLTPDVEFRTKLADFFDTATMRHALRALDGVSTSDATRRIYRLLGARGLLAPTWPEEFGGRGRGPDAAAAVAEELVARGVPDMPHVISVQTVGTVLLAVGSRSQCARWLPSLAAGTASASVLFTEPESGSDLSSLATTAKPTADGYELTGTKAYSLNAGTSDVGVCLARTSGQADGPGGLAMFLVPLGPAGPPTELIGDFGADQFHQVRLERFAVPSSALLGGERDGWRLLLRVLATERTGIDYHARSRHWFAATMTCAVAAAGTDRQIPPARLARLGAEVDAARLLAHQSLHRMVHGGLSDGAAALSKWYTSEVAARVGLAGAEWFGGEAGPSARVLAAAAREAPGLLVSGGASEVLLTTLAGLRVQQAGVADLVCDEDDALERELRRVVASAARDPERARAVLAELGAFGFGIAASNGGMDLGRRAVLMVCVESGRACRDAGYVETAVAAEVVASATNYHPRHRLLPEIAAGTAKVAVVTASDKADVTLDVMGDDAEWLVTGTGTAHGDPTAEHLLLMIRGRTDLMALLPATAVRSATADSHRPDQHTIELHRARLSPHQVLAVGPTAARLREATAPLGHLLYGGYLAGLGSGALSLASAHARGRWQFGRPLAELPSVATTLAELDARREIVLLTLTRLADAQDAARARPGASAEALAMAAEFALDATRTAVHLHGARGVVTGHPVQRHHLAVVAHAGRYGHVDSLWHEAGVERLRVAGQATAADRTRE